MKHIVVSFILLLISATSFAQTYRWVQLANQPLMFGYGTGLLEKDSIIYATFGQEGNNLGGFFKSTNNGDSWVDMSASGITCSSAYSLIKDSSNSLYTLVRSGSYSSSIWRSLNSGGTWTKLTFPISDYPVDITVDRHNNLYSIFINLDSIYDFRTLRKSTDRGESWTELLTTHSALYANPTIDTNNDIFVIEDKGNTVKKGVWFFSIKDSLWENLTDGLPTLNVASISTSPRGEILVGLEEDGVYKFSYEENRFLPSNIGIENVNIVTLFFSRSGRIYAGSKDRGIFYTDDGLHWSSMNLGLHHYYVKSFTELADGEILCSTWGGGLYRLQVTNSVVNGTKKSLSVSENPVSMFTSINYTSDKPSFVTLSLVDVQGKVVKQWIKSWMDAGSHGMPLDVSDLPNGVYTVLMRTNEELMTTRLVVSR